MKTSRRYATFGFVIAMIVGMSASAFAAKGAGKGAGQGGPIARIREILPQLSLTDEQQPKVDKILDDAQQQAAALRQEAKSSGNREAAIDSRSATSCRATIRSVPSLKIRTTDDSPSTDFDRKIFNPVVPLSEFSSGTLTRLSTSSVESPGASERRPSAMGVMSRFTWKLAHGPLSTAAMRV